MQIDLDLSRSKPARALRGLFRFRSTIAVTRIVELDLSQMPHTCAKFNSSNSKLNFVHLRAPKNGIIQRENKRHREQKND